MWSFDSLKCDLQLVDTAHQVTEEPLTKGRVSVEEPLHHPAPRPVRPWPEFFFHEVLQADLNHAEARLSVIGVVVFAKIVK